VAYEQDPQEPAASLNGKPNFLVRHWKALLVIVVLLVGFFILVRYIQNKQPVANPRGRFGQNGPVAVGAAVAQSGDIDLKIPGLGKVTPLATVTVRAQISGVMQKIYFTEGQLVHQGEVLAQIDPRPYEAALEQVQGNLKRDQALLADAKLDLKRYEGLVKEDSIAQQQLDTQRALVDQYSGTLEADSGQVKTAQVNLAYTRISAPVTGRVGLRQVDQGNYITPADSNGIVLINELQPITAIFTVPEDNVPAISKRLREGAALSVTALDRTLTTKLADGKLASFDNTIDSTTGTIKMRAQFDNLDNSLFPNQFVNIELLLNTLKNQIIIPNSAVRHGAPNGVNTTFVYVVNADRSVSVRPVTLGVLDGERVAISAGLSAGETVVTDGADRLRDGAAVVLPTDKPGTAPAGAAGAPSQDKPAAAQPGQNQHRRQRGDGAGRPPQS
jgi:multidrug efflux system membrane fusion protein